MCRKLSAIPLIVGMLVVSAGAGSAEVDPVARDEQTLREASLATDSPALLEFFRKRTTKDFDPGRIKALIRGLGDDSFEVRERSSAQLIHAGVTAIPFLREALKDPDIEIVRRAEECLRRLTAGSAAGLADAAARLLAVRKPAGAAEVLLAYLPLAEDEIVAEEVRRTLAAVAQRDGKAEPALMNALADPLPIRRAAAAAALGQAGPAEARQLVAKLLQDADLTVRLRAALALANAHEKPAIPVLIDLLAALPPEKTWPVQNLLYRAAGDQAPAAAPGTNDETRRKYRDAWADWWARNGERIDLTRLDQPPKPLGWTMVTLLDEGRIIDLDDKNQQRWEIRGLQNPLDAQLLPGDRVLVAEQAASRVAERDAKAGGKIVWQKQVAEPMMAQRLPNGNTFVAARNRLIEWDRDGTTVLDYRPRGSEQIRRAHRLPDGDIVLVASMEDDSQGIAARFVRLDPAGTTELQSFPVEVNTFGGRIDVLPNGHVLIPQMNRSRVVEYDARGRNVNEILVDMPIIAMRLPNGNTMVTCYSQLRAVELDRTGKEVWEYRAHTKVTRAWRH